MTTFPFGASTAPRRPTGLKVTGTLDPIKVAGLKKDTVLPAAVGMNIIRPSGKSKLPV